MPYRFDPIVIIIPLGIYCFDSTVYYSSIIEKTPNKRTKIPPSMMALDNIPILFLEILKN